MQGGLGHQQATQKQGKDSRRRSRPRTSALQAGDSVLSSCSATGVSPMLDDGYRNREANLVKDYRVER
jgi:hypothetical protein